MSGAWVHVGALRLRAIAALAPVAQDIVVTGHDREDVGLLVFPNPAGCAGLCTDRPKETPLAALTADARVRQRVAQGLRSLAEATRGESAHAQRAILLTEPPSIDGNEITDKGYINQRAVLARRVAAVTDLYRTPRSTEVIIAL
jgi:feruloyl-CoA synthase